MEISNHAASREILLWHSRSGHGTCAAPVLLCTPQAEFGSQFLLRNLTSLPLQCRIHVHPCSSPRDKLRLTLCLKNPRSVLSQHPSLNLPTGNFQALRVSCHAENIPLCRLGMFKVWPKTAALPKELCSTADFIRKTQTFGGSTTTG